MFVSHKKRYNYNNSSPLQDKNKNFIQRLPHSKLKIISGNVTRANSQSKVNLDQSSIASEELNQLKQSGIQSLYDKNHLKRCQQNRKMLTLSSRKHQKQHKNGSLNKTKNIEYQINNSQILNKNQQKKHKPIFTCQQFCYTNSLNDKIVLQTLTKKNIRCAISLTNSQIDSDKKMFMNPQMNDFPLNTKYQTPRKKYVFQNLGSSFKKQNQLSEVKYRLQYPQSSLIQKYEIKQKQKIPRSQKNSIGEYAKQSFNISTQQPSFQIFDPTQNNQLNLTEIFRQTIKQNKDQQQLQSGRTTIIDLLKDLQQSQNNFIANKSNQKFKTKVNFLY